jgi:hypothetical protein
MRDRHVPRLCRACQAPMARQEDTCWRCGTQWASEDGPRTGLRVIAGGVGTPAGGAPQPAIAAAVSGDARAATPARLEGDRWIDEGGSLGSEATGGSPAAAERR